MKYLNNYKAFKQPLLFLVAIVCTAILLPGCRKLVSVKTPNNRMLKDMVYDNEKTAIGVVNNVMSSMVESWQPTDGTLTGVQIFTGLSGDELRCDLNATTLPFLVGSYQNNVSPDLAPQEIGIWSSIYNKVFILNDILEGVSSSTALPSKVKNQLLGEARFLRAFCYFYLGNIYCNVPMILSTDYSVNSSLPRSSQDKVFNQIIIDLKEAQQLLSDQFLDGTLLQSTSEKVRPTKWAASALLARIYLYTNKWDLAEKETDKLLSNASPFKLDSLNGVFLKNSNEAIWQVQPTGATQNTNLASFYYLTDGVGPELYRPTYLNERLVSNFEPNDGRKKNWMKSIAGLDSREYWFVTKYKAYLPITLNDPLTEYYMMLRLGEQYLIRAEARAQQEKIADALKDLNEIRKRAGLEDISISSKPEILDAILQERRVELFVEWGDRWFDLRRVGKIDDVMKVVAPEKGGTWSSYKKYFPISNQDRLLNKNLDQTEGY